MVRRALTACRRESASTRAAKAHELCPYSNAVRGNVDVTLRAAGTANG
ncbi:hypothetical protein [Plantactinospora mayteni]|nr:hypothetical protein [Plantactinospora mayteni]